MPTHPRRLELLRRLERLRAIEQREAAMRVAEARDTQGKLFALGERSGDIAAAYAARRDAVSGDELARLLGFLGGLGQIRQDTASQHRRAEALSAEALAQLQLAERRRDLTRERLGQQQRLLRQERDAREAANPVLARKLKG